MLKSALNRRLTMRVSQVFDSVGVLLLLVRFQPLKEEEEMLMLILVDSDAYSDNT